MAAWGRILLVAIASGAIVAGCGGEGDGQLPPDDAEILLDRLNEVERGLAEGNCDGPRGAKPSAELLRQQVGDGELSRVPEDLDPEVRELLVEGTSHLVELVEQECGAIEEQAPQETETDPEPADPVEPVEPAEPVDPVEPPADEPPKGGRGQGQGPPPEPGQSGDDPDGGSGGDQGGPSEEGTPPNGSNEGQGGDQGDEPPTGGIGG